MGIRNVTDVFAGDRQLVNTTVIFSGIRDFSSIVNTLSQASAFGWLVMFTNIMTPIVKNRRGIIDKFLGDGMMVLNKNPTWVCPSTSSPLHPLHPPPPPQALYTAMEMQRAVDRMNEDKSSEHGPKLVINMGISLHTGLVCAGVIGDAERLSTTIISNVVNLAARFERLTKYYGARILVSTATTRFIQCLDRYAHRSIGRVRVKGSTEVYDLIDVFHTDSGRDSRFKTETHKTFEEALLLYANRNWEEAARKFKAHLPLYPSEVCLNTL